MTKCATKNKKSCLFAQYIKFFTFIEKNVESCFHILPSLANMLYATFLFGW